jgi:endonuclease/exonuclease/phosphatase (EEP) superfamily protein YafD
MNAVVNLGLFAGLAGVIASGFAALFARAHPLIDAFAQFLLPAVAAAAVLALLAVVTGRYAMAAAAVAALVLNLALAWPWLQSPPVQAANGPHFKLLLFNVYYYNQHLDLVAPMARKTDADIIVLLEVVPHIRAELDELAAQYPFKIECWQMPRCDALILSRFPLVDSAPTLPPARTTRSLASVVVDVKGRLINLFAAHLILPFPFTPSHMQPAQAAEVAQALKASSGARLLVGDFNAAVWAGAITHIREEAGLTALTGPGGSWPAFLPRHIGIPIDNVLASPELALISRELIDVEGSDHRAVLAEIAFKE